MSESNGFCDIQWNLHDPSQNFVKLCRTLVHFLEILLTFVNLLWNLWRQIATSQISFQFSTTTLPILLSVVEQTNNTRDTISRENMVWMWVKLSCETYYSNVPPHDRMFAFFWWRSLLKLMHEYKKIATSMIGHGNSVLLWHYNFGKSESWTTLFCNQWRDLAVSFFTYWRCQRSFSLTLIHISIRSISITSASHSVDAHAPGRWTW